MRKAAFVSALVLIAFVSSGDKPRISVLDFEHDENLTDKQAINLTERLLSEFQRTGDYVVVDRATRDAALDEMAFSQTGCVEITCVVDVGRMLSAQYMITCTIAKYGTTWSIVAKTVDVEKGVVTESKSFEVAGDVSGLLAAMSKVAAELGAERVTIGAPVGGATGVLAITSSPSGATVFIGTEKLTTPIDVAVPPGDYSLTFVLSGYKTETKMVTAAAGKTTPVAVALVQIKGSARVYSDPVGATVTIENSQRGKTSASGLLVSALPAGDYLALLQLDGYEAATATFSITTADEVAVRATLKPKPASLVVTSTPQGATVYLDGKSIGATPTNANDLTPGEHTVRFVLAGYDERSGTVTLRPGKAEVVDWALLPAGTTLPTVPATPPSSVGRGQIAFVSYRDGNYEIYVMDESGANQRRLTNNSAVDHAPSLSPDGRQLAFGSYRDVNSEIYVMNADGTNQRNLTNNSAVDGRPSWSPDGSRIAFMSDRDWNAEIYVMNADGTGVRRLTNNSAGDWGPTWSPDGHQIAFESDRDGNYEIYVMNADGTGVRRLTNNSALDLRPSWSPDGRQIAFRSGRDGNWEIYVMDASGANQRRLTNNSASDEGPSWSPDGRQIAFASDRDGSGEIYVMDASGANQRRLTFNDARDENPAWSPR